MSPIVSRRTLQITLFWGSCLFFLASLAMLWRACRITAVQVADAFGVNDAAIRCVERSADCGGVRIGQPVQYAFRLFNVSNETRHILKVIPGCSCTKVVDFSKNIAPRSWGEVKVQIDTTGNPGIRQSSVLIETDDPTRPHINPLVTCRVLPAIETKPHALRFVPQESTSDFPSQTFDVVAIYPDEKVAIGTVLVSDPSISFTKAAIDDKKLHRLILSVSKDVPAGITLANLDIDIEGSVQKSVRLPITIANEVKLKATPSTLEFPVDNSAKKGALRAAEFTVKSLAKGHLEVNSVKLTGTSLKFSTKQMADNTIAIRLEDLAVTRDLDRKHICISTNRGELRVPITLCARTNDEGRKQKTL